MKMKAGAIADSTRTGPGEAGSASPSVDSVDSKSFPAHRFQRGREEMLGFDPGHPTYSHDPNQVSSPPWASVSSSVKGEQRRPREAQ